MFNQKLFFLALSVLFLLSCSDSTSPSSDPKQIQIGLSHDTLWFWDGGSRSISMDLSCKHLEDAELPYTVSFYDPYAKVDREFETEAGFNNLNFTPPVSIDWSDESIKRVILNVIREHCKPAEKSVFLGIGGTKIQMELVGASTRVASRGETVFINWYTHPYATSIFPSVFGQGETHSEASETGWDGTSFLIPTSAAPGSYYLKVVSTRKYFYRSDTLTVQINVS